MNYEYRPVPDRRPALAVVAALSVAAVCGMMPVQTEYAPPLRAAAAACALAAIMTATRFLVCRYAYAIDARADGTFLVVRDLRGGRVLSVMAAEGGKIEKFTPELRRRLKEAGIITVNRCVDIFPRESYVFIPKTANEEKNGQNTAPDERCALRFQPDGTIVGMIGQFFSE